ncbi:MAG TPA: sensor histidine kinase [Gaiellaceae bacterium]|nr:sensor histidine kinase [Gaiellaceae bacterium]
MGEAWSEHDASLELGLRVATVQVGWWLGWASVIVVGTGISLDAGAHHVALLVALTVAAAAANGAAMTLPWREWLAKRRGQLLLDLWSAGLLGFVALLVVAGGSSFALLLFLVAPFIAVVQTGRRRIFWLVATAVTCAVSTALAPVSTSETAMRVVLVASIVALALILTRAIRREAVAQAHAAIQVEVARTFAAEASHRIKNDLQTVADLLLLGRPIGTDGVAFDETADRIRSIATVHRLLSETEGFVDGPALLRGVTAFAPVPVAIDADHATFDAATAQKVGIVANELVTNAFRHGAEPIEVRLTTGTVTRLSVDDRGTGAVERDGLGLALVRRLVEQGLHGRFELSRRAGGGMHAEVVFPTVAQ